MNNNNCNSTDLFSEQELLEMFYDSNEKDPRSPFYKRTLTYPKIKKMKVFVNITLSIIGLALLIIVLWLNTKSILITLLASFITLFIYLLLRLKSIIIFLVECYQLLAPTEMRMKCRFEPSCSDYMILAVKKYGAIRGAIKGIKRIRRCKYPNGGYDEP